MHDFLLMLNGKAIADFRGYERALSAFRRRMLSIDPAADVLELYNTRTGHRCASSI